MTLYQALEAKRARHERGPWVPACGGTEVPFKLGFYRYQYMFQQSTGTHALICLDTDLFLSDAEADRLLA